MLTLIVNKGASKNVISPHQRHQAKALSESRTAMLRDATLCDAMRRYISLATENIEIPSGFFDVQRPAKGHWLVHIASPAPGQRGPWAGTNH